MKKLFYLLMIGSLAFVSCEVQDSADETLNAVQAKGASTDLYFPMDGCTGSTRDLIAGQNTVVGTVTVAEDGDNYVVTYNISAEDYCLTEAHVDVADEPANFPVTNSGNPKIGKFDYSNDAVGCENEFSVTVPNTGLWIAVHGVVECSTNSFETVIASLPETVNFCGLGGYGGMNSYIPVEIDGGALTGQFGSWCVDNDLFINASGCYENASVYVITEGLPDGVENGDNVDAVNWLLNNNKVGELSSDGVTPYTYGDVQYALWLLLDPIEDDQPGLGTLGDYSVERAQEIAEMALASGEGFMPDCGDYVGIILKADGIQPLMIPYWIECQDCEETIWAEGCGFPGNSWAMYFKFN